MAFACVYFPIITSLNVCVCKEIGLYINYIICTGHFHMTTYSLPETNISPENGWLECYFPVRGGLASGAMLILGRVSLPFQEGQNLAPVDR